MCAPETRTAETCAADMASAAAEACTTEVGSAAAEVATATEVTAAATAEVTAAAATKMSATAAAKMATPTPTAATSLRRRGSGSDQNDRQNNSQDIEFRHGTLEARGLR